MQALREELRRQRTSTYFTADKEFEGTMTTLHVDSEHNKHLESQIAQYGHFELSSLMYCSTEKISVFVTVLCM